MEDNFKQFLTDRVRPCPGEFATFKELYKAFTRWAITTREVFQPSKKIPVVDFRMLCDKHFGYVLTEKGYPHTKVFLDEEDVEEWEKTPDTAYTQAVPSDVMADYILSKDNKRELVRGLIEDKRVLSSEIDSLETQVANLEQCIKRKEQYTEKLLNKIALLYVGLPDDYRPQSEIQHSSS